MVIIYLLPAITEGERFHVWHLLECTRAHGVGKKHQNCREEEQTPQNPAFPSAGTKFVQVQTELQEPYNPNCLDTYSATKVNLYRSIPV